MLFLLRLRLRLRLLLLLLLLLAAVRRLTAALVATLFVAAAIAALLAGAALAVTTLATITALATPALLLHAFRLGRFDGDGLAAAEEAEDAVDDSDRRRGRRHWRW